MIKIFTPLPILLFLLWEGKKMQAAFQLSIVKTKDVDSIL